MHQLRGGTATGGSSEQVERYFGGLIDDVALEAPVSRTRLVDGLAVVEARAQAPESPLERPLHCCDGIDGLVYVIRVGTWNELTTDLLPETCLAVRETHRRMSRVLVDVELPPRTDPIVTTG